MTKLTATDVAMMVLVSEGREPPVVHHHHNHQRMVERFKTMTYDENKGWGLTEKGKNTVRALMEAAQAVAEVGAEQPKPNKYRGRMQRGRIGT